MNNLCIHHHTGLGDHFNCCGMVRYLSRSYNTIHVITKQKYVSIIEYMYQKDANIIVAEIPSEPWNLERKFAYEYCETNHLEDLLVVGHQYYPWDSPILKIKNPWELFYDQLQLDYEIRTKYFIWNRIEKEENKIIKLLNPNNKRYAFIHEDKTRGLSVDRSLINKDLFIIENPNNINPFFLYKLLIEAEEIHCIDSSIKCLIDLIPMQAKLFLHKVRDYAVGVTSNTWTVI